VLIICCTCIAVCVAVSVAVCVAVCVAVLLHADDLLHLHCITCCVSLTYMEQSYLRLVCIYAVVSIYCLVYECLRVSAVHLFHFHRLMCTTRIHTSILYMTCVCIYGGMYIFVYMHVGIRMYEGGCCGSNHSCMCYDATPIYVT